YFSIDKEMVYWNFYLDFGPLNLGHLYRFCQLLNNKLNDPKLKDKVIFYYSHTHAHKRTNAAFLISSWSLLYQNKSPEDAFKPFKNYPAPFPPWHDATPSVCTFNLTILDTLKGLAKAREHRFFDFTRFIPSNFGGWDDLSRKEFRAPDLFYNGGSGAGASYVNGRMICRPAVTLADLIAEWKREQDGSDRRYASFKIYDRKNNKNVEASCSPEHLSNYFQKSDLPWEISPAFFRPEVLHRFKADPEKYAMDDRSISCRGAWYLKSYDINDAGQVHAYIGDLAHLPFEEQMYWQSFNEWPKGTISKRAHQNDILGEFSTEYDPLNAIKRKVKLLDDASPSWWKPRDEKLSDAAR
ncbi:MAG: hypothetical protein F9K51_07775, partial [Candidatus Dadabacteria bacterium]